MESKVELHVQDFASFFERWLRQQEAYLQQLLGAPRDPSHETELGALVAAVMDHYRTYYAAKREMARVRVGDLFNPPWLSPMERAMLWMAGCRPRTMLRLVRTLREAGEPGSGLWDLSEEQVRKLEELGEGTRAEEEKVERDMRRFQLAFPGIARLGGNRGAEDVVMKALLAGAEKVVAEADELRVKVLEGVVSLLNPLQRVDFLAATALLRCS